MANISQRWKRCLLSGKPVWAGKGGKRRRERKGDIKENAKKKKKKSLHVGIPFFWRKFDADVSAFGRRYDTFIDPVASNVYESLFEREDESIDARQVHAWLKHASLFLLSPRLWCTLSGLAFYSEARNARRSFKPDGALRGSCASIVRLYFSFDRARLHSSSTLLKKVNRRYWFFPSSSFHPVSFFFSFTFRGETADPNFVPEFWRIIILIPKKSVRLWIRKNLLQFIRSREKSL